MTDVSEIRDPLPVPFRVNMVVERGETRIGKAYEELKDRIIAGHYHPGEKLRVEHLKRDFGVSGSTLREALTMLIADRLVVAEGQRGFKVMPVSVEDLLDLSRTRIHLETEAVRQAIAYGNEAWEGQIVSAFHILSRAHKDMREKKRDGEAFGEAFNQWEDRHRAFHYSLFSATPSEWTRYFLVILYHQSERYRRMFQNVIRKTPKRNTEDEHAQIVEAVLARDADRAAELIERHLRITINEWIQHFHSVNEGKAA